MMQPTTEVVVLDDMSRFAGHVWQYLSGRMSFGIGSMSDDGKGRGRGGEPLILEVKPLPIPSGVAQVRWINAGLKKWDKRLETTLAEIEGNPACFLIDVRGPIHAGQAGYEWELAIQLVKRWRSSSPSNIFLVSSYRTGSKWFQGEDFVIHPKTWRTLEQIAQKLHIQDANLTDFNILVTGAGFEMANALGGAHGFGMPPTAEILRSGWERCGYGGDFEAGKLPIPSKLTAGMEKEDHLQPLRDAATADSPDLDSYWNEALSLVLERTRLAKSHLGNRNQKVAASLEEYRVREAFRQAFLNDDWGYLNQALDAAALNWVAWLSTNYTGFADRSLVLAQRYGKTSSPDQPWAIVSTSNEAIQLIRNILHGDKPEPVLFKLHGHIEHLLTMAVAGQDKELYSTLSLPVDSLHEVYTAAELFLKRRLETASRVVWHVVGHGLKDALLVDLMKRVCKSTACDYRFLFVGPKLTTDAEQERRNFFSTFDLNGHHFVFVPLFADEYLSRLRRVGLCDEDFQDLHAWRDRLISLPHRPHQ